MLAWGRVQLISPTLEAVREADAIRRPVSCEPPPRFLFSLVTQKNKTYCSSIIIIDVS